MSPFYILKFNAAVAAIGVSPTVFPIELRNEVQTFARRRKLTPQEGALVLVSNLSVGNLPNTLDVAIAVWRKEAKIDSSKPEIVEALERIGYAV